MKPEPQTELGRWMRENRYSDQGFADAVTKEMRAMGFHDASITSQGVAKWRLGTSIPRKTPMQAIKKITGLTADSFVEEPIGTGT